MVQMVREGAETGFLPNSSDFMKEFEVSRRTAACDLEKKSIVGRSHFEMEFGSAAL